MKSGVLTEAVLWEASFFWQIPLWKHWVTVHITTQTPGCWLAALSPLLPIQPSDPNLCLHSKQNRDANSSASRFTEIKYRSMSPWCVVSSNGFVLCPLFLHLKYVRLVVTKSCVSWARATFFWGSYDKDCYCNKPRKKTMNELFIYSICTLHALIPTKKKWKGTSVCLPSGWMVGLRECDASKATFDSKGDNGEGDESLSCVVQTTTNHQWTRVKRTSFIGWSWC